MMKNFFNYILDGWKNDDASWGHVLMMFVTMFFASSVLSFTLITIFLIAL